MATPDPHRYWSGAPKHWVHVPAQRHCPPAPEQLDAVARLGAVARRPTPRGRGRRGEWSVAAVALAVAVAAFVLIGTGGAVADEDAPASERTGGTSTR